MATRIPAVRTIPDVAVLRGGLDLATAPLIVKPGFLRFAINYEALLDGGYERVGGIERFDGQARPSDAVYALSAPNTVAYAGVVVGDVINGATSGVTGKVIAIAAASADNPLGFLVTTQMTGSFTIGENIRVGVAVIGVHLSEDAVITGVDDNVYSAAAAEIYRPAILQVPGTGPIRGVAVLNGTVYAWRNVGSPATAIAIYKSTVAGWVNVPMYHEISFTAGTVTYAEGSTLSKGGNTATVKRMVLETGTFGAGTAAGRMIITVPAPGNFTAGLAGGGGVVTLSGPNTVIALSPNGRVETRVYNFFGSAGTKRLYGCDGINREFEFDGDVLTPITTGMGSIRARHVTCHKNQLMFAYEGSTQNSGINSPYQWTPLTGAAELGTGDTITGYMPFGGSEAASALMVFCQDSLFVLYGSSSADWKLVKLSEDAGANAYSVQDIGKPMTHDTPGFRSYVPTMSFGNFAWELDSRLIDALANQQHPVCSVFSKALSRYRCFFQDGSSVTATPIKTTSGNPLSSPIEGYQWMAVDLGRNIVVADSAEISGITRTFYGDDQGWVLEADVGRSFDGEVIDHAIKTVFQHQKSPMVIKQYRRPQVEAQGFSAFSLYIGAEFSDGDPDVDPTEVVDFQQLVNYGSALIWDGGNYDQAVWDSGQWTVKRVQLQGQGVSVATLMGGSSAIEMPHQLKSLMWQYTPLRGAI